MTDTPDCTLEFTTHSPYTAISDGPAFTSDTADVAQDESSRSSLCARLTTCTLGVSLFTLPLCELILLAANYGLSIGCSRTMFICLGLCCASRSIAAVLLYLKGVYVVYTEKVSIYNIHMALLMKHIVLLVAPVVFQCVIAYEQWKASSVCKHEIKSISREFWIAALLESWMAIIVIVFFVVCLFAGRGTAFASVAGVAAVLY